ncbi:MAG: hypothetical protein HY822_10115 [Acidobacteria bacterium]|nr:hypothetical protein [Acidobacteriota bacterium]
MRTMLLAGFALAAAALPQEREPPPPKLPDGRSQTEEILKSEHKKSLADAAELVRLSRQLQAELEKNDRHVVSLTSIRTTEEIEKLARRIRGRLRRH